MKWINMFIEWFIPKAFDGVSSAKKKVDDSAILQVLVKFSVIAGIVIAMGGSIISSLSNIGGSIKDSASSYGTDTAKGILKGEFDNLKVDGLVGVVTGAFDDEYKSKLDEATNGYYSAAVNTISLGKDIYDMTSIDGLTKKLTKAALNKTADIVVDSALAIANGEFTLEMESVDYANYFQSEAVYMNSVFGYGNWEMWGGRKLSSDSTNPTYTYYATRITDLPECFEGSLVTPDTNIKYIEYMASAYNVLYIPVGGFNEDSGVVGKFAITTTDRRDVPALEGDFTHGGVYRITDREDSLTELVFEYYRVNSIDIVGGCYVAVLDNMVLPITGSMYRGFDVENDMLSLKKVYLTETTWYYEVNGWLKGDEYIDV